VPKYVALSYPERYARLVARPISLFIKLTSFFSQLLSGLARRIVWLLGIRRDPSSALISEEEINQMIIEGREKGIFDPTEEALVRSVFEFADSNVRRAMTPRTDVVGINVRASSTDIMSAITEHGYSRYPVFKETIDTIVGVIYTKDLITAEADLANIDLNALIREPFFVPDSMPLSQLLREFQKGKNHMAVVLDDFGGTAGLVTLEDILEELVGEIQDEYDAEAAPLIKHSDTVAYAVGTVWPGQVNEMLSTHLPEEKADTLAGLFIDAAGYVPEKRESLNLADARLTVLAKDENRIIRLKVEKLMADADSVG
jgi:putative hemolysin